MGSSRSASYLQVHSHVFWTYIKSDEIFYFFFEEVKRWRGEGISKY